MNLQLMMHTQAQLVTELSLQFAHISRTTAEPNTLQTCKAAMENILAVSLALQAMVEASTETQH